MKSFLTLKKTPLIKWGSLPNNTFFEGKLPEGYSLAVCPGEYIVLDVDRHGDVNGFSNLPPLIHAELLDTYQYKTKNNGKHYWLKYTGDKVLANKASGQGIDLRVGYKGYVVYYPAKDGDDIRKHVDEIQETSVELNLWLEKLFSYK